jgi:2-isopropylmalate synthase
MMPDELSAFLTDLRTNTPALEKVSLGICCENKYGMALAATVSAIKAGAQEVKTAVGDALSPSLDGFAAILRDCGDREGICASLKFTEMRRITKQIEWIVDQRGEGTSAGRASSEADVAEQEIALVSDASQESVSAVVAQLGYDLSDEDGMKVYEEFRRLSEKKKVTSKDLDAIVANVALQVPPTYRLIEYVTNSGNAITATAHIKMEKNGEMLEGVSLGDGPIDAAFRAIEQIVGRHFELDDFQIQSVTEGREAMGSALVRLRNNGKLYSGNGISTDIIGASIRAYLSALNKITYEEA